MKKTYLVVMLTALTVLGWSQSSNYTTRQTKEHDAQRTEELKAAFSTMKAELNSKESSRAADFPQWVSFYDALAGAGIDGVTAFPFIFPDTLPVIAVSGDPFHMSRSASGFAFAVAQTFHPSNPVYGAGYDDESAFSTSTVFSVDSMRFYYAYTRNTESTIVDTLRVHIIGPSVNFYTVNGDTDEDPSIVLIEADTPGHAPLDPHTTVEVLLDSTMATADNSLDIQSVDLSAITLNKDEKFTIALEYIPGSTYSLGDTLIAADGITPANPINYFQVGTLDEEEGGELISQTLTEERNWNMASIRNPYFHESWAPFYVSAPIYETSTFFQIEQLLMDFFVSDAKYPDFVVSKDGLEVSCGNSSSFDAKQVTWDFGDDSGNSKLGESVTYTYGDRGSFDITMTAKEEGTNASFTKVKRVTVDFRDNIEEIEDLISLNIFPNPAFNTLNINMSLNDVETINVAVLDMHGRVVYTNEMNSNGINEKIDVSNFAAGLYQVRIIAGETTVSNSIQIGE